MKNIFKIFLLLVPASFTIHYSISQPSPGIQWQNTIGGNRSDNLYSVQQTSDGGYILGGKSNSDNSGDKSEFCHGITDYWIVKTDFQGNVLWENTIGGSNHDNLNVIQQTSDGGYILGGESGSNISGDKTENSNGFTDYWIVKTDSIGNIQWQNSIGGNHQDRLYSLQPTSDGGYILAGESQSDSSGDKTENSRGYEDYWIVKTDALGNILWDKTIGGRLFDSPYSIQQTYDGGYIVGGYSNSPISGDKTETCLGGVDYWILKVDSLGNIQWQNTIGGTQDDELNDIQQTSDGGYILGGSSKSNISGDKTENNWDINSFSPDYWILKTDSLGTIQWQNTIGGILYDQFYSLSQTNDGGFALGGTSSSNISGDKTQNSKGGLDFWLVKTNDSGNVQWQNTIGGSLHEYLWSMQQTSDGGYILAGSSNSDSSADKTENSNGDWDYWIVKHAPNTLTGILSLGIENPELRIYPSPFTTQATVAFDNLKHEVVDLFLIDLTGRLIETSTTTSGKITLEKGNKPAGIYLIRLTNNKTGEQAFGKIIIAD